MEKLWVRQEDGNFKVKGNIEVSQVYMSRLVDGEWSKPYVTFKRTGR